MTTLTKAVGGASALVAAGVLSYAGIGFLKGRQQQAPAPQAAAAAPAGVKTEVRTVTHWAVRYHDSTLGTVEGRAVVDWEHSKATVTFEDGGGKAILTANDVEIDKSATTVTMRLRGRSPEAPGVAPPSTAGMKRIPTAEGETLAVTPSEPSFSSAVKAKAAAEGDGVHIALRAESYGALKGEWSYLADPLTQRNAGGTGRTGYYHLLKDDEGDDPRKGLVGLQSGREEWWPLPAEITLTTVMEDQLSANESLARYYYPYTGTPAPDPKVTTRTLFVVGRHLPVDRGKVMQPIRWNDSDNLQAYRVLALSTDADLTPENKERIEEGWQQVTQALDAEAAQEARRVLEAALIAVDLKEGVLAGPKQFAWGEATGSWFLQFGNNLAEARFVRPVKMKTANDATSTDEYERTPCVFLPERVAVEVETWTSLPLESMPVRIATKAAPSTQTTLIARRVGRTSIYRTELISVSKGGQPSQGMLALRPGDELIATVQTDDVQFVAPPFADANVLLAPDRLADAPRDPKGGPQVRLWKEALVLAARANDVAATDFSTLPGHKLPPYRGIPMTVGDHAAMLLLRSAFLDMMRQQLEQLDKIETDKDVEAFREWVRPFMEDRGEPMASDDPPIGWEKYPDYLRAIDDINLIRQWIVSRPVAGLRLAIETLNVHKKVGFGSGTYFGELPVPGPLFGEWQYFTTYFQYGDHAFRFIRWDRRGHREWRLKATRAVIKRYRNAVATTIETVKAIPDNDRTGLLKLTGLGFGTVVGRVIPQLMRLDDSTGVQQWVPDYPARGAVANLHAFGAAVRASEDYSSAKDRAMLEIAGALLTWGAPGLILSESTAAAFTTIGGLGLLAWQGGHEIYDQVIVRRDLELFFGASVVLGAAQLEELNAQKVSITDVVLEIAAQHAISSIWGEIAEPPAPVPAPKKAASLLPFGSVTLLAAADPPKASRFKRSMRAQVLARLGVLSAEGTLARLGAMTRVDLSRSTKPVIQGFLILTQEGGIGAELRGVCSREQRVAQYLARRIRRETDAGPAPNPSPDAMGYGGGAGGRAAPVPPRQDQPLVPPRRPPAPDPPAAVARPREFPRSSNPPDGALVPFVENTRTVYYETEGITNDAQPLRNHAGRSADVYYIKDVLSRDRSILSGDGVVLKVMKDDPQMGTARDQILRIREVYELVRSMGIECAEILEFHENADRPYLIQRRIRPGNGVRLIRPAELIDMLAGGRLPVQNRAAIERIFTRDLQMAVVELYFRLGLQQAISPDLSLGNLYFRNVGGRWVAGILDVDHVVRFPNAGEGRSGVTWDWLREIRDKPEDIGSLVADGRALTTAMTFMEKAFELKYGGHYNLPWIEFDEATNTMRPVLLDPQLVRRFGDFQMQPRPRPTPGRGR